MSAQAGQKGVTVAVEGFERTGWTTTIAQWGVNSREVR
jgi:hypothetical protein